ncbi:MAG: LysR family transcriptional regulator [Proteobacteria bacterium]|nr:LysR family transcriptional regulator [Pseudomonadota bacterium]
MLVPATHLGALRGFEAAARLRSFAKAAAELHLTQSAISHQVRALEDALGQPLFRRVGRAVVPTDAGNDFAETVRRALRELETGVARLAPYLKPRSVVVYADGEFARGMLLPHLGEFLAANPGLDLWLDTTGREVDFEHHEVDVLVTRSTRVPSAQATGIVLAADRRVPLASPAFIAARGGAPADPAGLSGWPLLHDESQSTWRAWFHSAGVRGVDAEAGPSFSDPTLALEAAVRGHGLVLASTVAASGHLESGTLAPVSRHGLDGPAYRLYRDARALDDETIGVVCRWIEAIAARAVAVLPDRHPAARMEARPRAR